MTDAVRDTDVRILPPRVGSTMVHSPNRTAAALIRQQLIHMLRGSIVVYARDKPVKQSGFPVVPLICLLDRALAYVEVVVRCICSMDNHALLGINELLLLV
jgi:hypothetical protein